MQTSAAILLLSLVAGPVGAAEPPVAWSPAEPPVCVCSPDCNCTTGACPAGCTVFTAQPVTTTKSQTTTTTKSSSVTTGATLGFTPVTVRQVVYSRGFFGRLRAHTITRTVQVPVQTFAPQPPTARVGYVTPGGGHTHTCAACGTTWDHASVPGHNCPRCGTYQNVQDIPGTVFVTTTAGGCANGQCRFR